MNLGGVEIVFRPAVEDDLAFIFSTWVRSALERAPARRRRTAAAKIRAEAEAHIRSCGAVVACSASHPRTLHGWACGEAAKLHYVYIPFGLRGTRLVWALVSASRADSRADQTSGQAAA